MVDNNKNNTNITNIIDLIIKNKDNSNEIKKILELISDKEDICRNYSKISTVVFSLDDVKFRDLRKILGLDDSTQDDLSPIIASVAGIEDKNIYENLNHLWNHISLSCEQKKYIDNNIYEVTNKASEISEKIDNMSKKISSVYSEFVGILGVFTALSFALMGSVQVFGNLLNNVENPSIKNIGYILVVAGIYLLLIYLVIMTLFIGMKKVFGQDKKYTFSLSFVLIFLCICVGLISSGLFCVTFG